MTESKVCTKCGIEKPLTEFYKNKQSKDGYRFYCKACNSIQGKISYGKRKAKTSQYGKKYRENNKLHIKNVKASRYLNHIKPDYKNNKKHIHKVRNKRRSTRIKEDVNFRLMETYRKRIQESIKNQTACKNLTTLELLGCSIEKCRLHIEKQFQKGMDWTNYGLHGWHIDHRIPCASFDFRDPEQQKACFHFTNLQPLWAEDNMKKSDKIIYLI